MLLVFTSKEHQDRFKFSLARDKAEHDRERKALLYILATDILADLAPNFYDFSERMIIPEALDNIPLSSAQRALVELGFNLYNGYISEQTTVDFFRHLDKTNFNVALEAIRLRFDGGLDS